MIWRPEDYGNITKLSVPTTEVWIPDIALYNRMTICPEWYGVGEAVINCGFCGAYVCEECYMRHLAMCGPDDEKQKVDETTKAS
ncbi:unnamed protein product [Rotaria sp. Silwood2]|nr:unnamed protein product [Rotaria sp. Silwood2]